LNYEFFELTFDAIKSFKSTDKILLGWYSPQYGYAYANYSSDEGTVPGLDCPADGLPVYIKVADYNGHVIDTATFQKQILGVFLGRDFYLFNPESVKKFSAIYAQYQDAFRGNDNYAMTPSAEILAYVKPPLAFWHDDGSYYGSWFSATSIPDAKGDVRLGAYWYLKAFETLKIAAINVGIEHRRNMRRATNAGYVGMITTFISGGAAVFSSVSSQIAADQGWTWLAPLKQAYSIYNLSDTGIDFSDASDTVPTDFDTTILESVNMDDIDISAATTDYAGAFPGFGESPPMDIYFDDSLQGSIVNNGDTFTGSEATMEDGAVTFTVDRDPTIDVPESPMDSTVDGAFNDGGSDSLYSTPDSPDSISGIDPSKLINGGKSIYTMSQSNGQPTRAPVGNNPSPLQIGTNRGTDAGAQTDRTLTQTLNSWMRNAGTVADVASTALRGVSRIQNTVAATRSNINAVNAPSKNQLAALRSNRGATGGTSKLPVAVWLIGGLGVAYLALKGK
jgi:hypothetical protein